MNEYSEKKAVTNKLESDCRGLVLNQNACCSSSGQYWNQGMNPQGLYGAIDDQRLWYLSAANEQLFEKTKELSYILENMMVYGRSCIEPWRLEISSMVEGILCGAKNLESVLYSTIEDCKKLDKKVDSLAEEVMMLKESNERILKEYDELVRKSKQSDYEDLIVEEVSAVSFPNEKQYPQGSEIKEEFTNALGALKELTKIEFLSVYERLEKIEDETAKKFQVMEAKVEDVNGHFNKDFNPMTVSRMCQTESPRRNKRSKRVERRVSFQTNMKDER